MTDGPRWLQIAGWSGLGKTTILEELIVHAKARGESVTALKFSDHTIDDSGDSGRLAGAGAEAQVLVGANGVFWHQNNARSMTSILNQITSDWLLVEGGRMLTTGKILLVQGQWPPHRGPLLATLGASSPDRPTTLSLNLPDSAREAARWIDRYRLAYSLPADQWKPRVEELFANDFDR